MAHALTETAIHTPEIVVPDDGESLDAASIQSPISQLTNRSALVHAQLTGVTPATALRTTNGIFCGTDMTCNEDLFVFERTILSGILTVAGATTLSAGLTVTGKISNTGGAIETTAYGANANAAITPRTANCYIAPLTLSANRVWTINDTDCTDGDWLEVSNTTQPHDITIISPSSAQLAVLNSGGSGINGNEKYTSAIFRRVSGEWVFCGGTIA